MSLVSAAGALARKLRGDGAPDQKTTDKIAAATLAYEAPDSKVRSVVEKCTKEFHNTVPQTIQDVIDYGTKLSNVKSLLEVTAQLGPGRFDDWIRTEFPWGPDTARRAMFLAPRAARLNDDTRRKMPQDLLVTIAVGMKKASSFTRERLKDLEEMNELAANALQLVRELTPPGVAQTLLDPSDLVPRDAVLGAGPSIIARAPCLLQGLAIYVPVPPDDPAVVVRLYDADTPATLDPATSTTMGLNGQGNTLLNQKQDPIPFAKGIVAVLEYAQTDISYEEPPAQRSFQVLTGTRKIAVHAKDLGTTS